MAVKNSSKYLVMAFGVIATLLVALSFISAKAIEQKGMLPASFISPDGSSSKQVFLKIVNNHADRQRGLMYEKSLPLDTGMLFVFPAMAVQEFWMKNTFLSLDIIFIDEDKKIVGIKRNAIPQSTDTISVEKPSKYVIELVAGSAEKLGLYEGQSKVVFHGPVPDGIF